jgi:hypothetical protein
MQVSTDVEEDCNVFMNVLKNFQDTCVSTKQIQPVFTSETQMVQGDNHSTIYMHR